MSLIQSVAELEHNELPMSPLVFALIAAGVLVGLLLVTLAYGKGRPHS